MMNGGRNSNRFPFTPSQWQELEHQALVFKYMTSGIPIPPDLLFSIKRASLDHSPLSSRLMSLPPHHNFGWNYLEMGLGRKIDTEPGRCRRTDGKKWRCSKEAYPNSKYCERHMHRGNNRLRKPLQQQGFKTTLTPPTNNNNRDSLTVTRSNNTAPPSLSLTTTTHSSSSFHHNHHSFLYNNHQPSSRSSSSGFSFSLQDDTASQLSSAFAYDGLKEEVDEHSFFTEPSGTMRSFSASSMEDSSWQLTPLSMNSSYSSSWKQRSYSGLSTEYSSYLQLQNQTNQQDQDCYNMLGLGKSEEPQNHKTVHRFFDEWPNKSKNSSWLDLDDKSSTTQLSISIPTITSDQHDHFPSFNFRTHQDV